MERGDRADSAGACSALKMGLVGEGRNWEARREAVSALLTAVLCNVNERPRL